MSSGLSVAQSKRVERVNTAGRSAEGMGWLVILLAPLGAFIYHLHLGAALILWLFTVIVGCYLIFSGKYILYSNGTHNRSFLWVNFFVSLLFIGGIIPLIVTIETVIAIFAYGKLVKELGMPEIDDKSLPLKSKEIAIFILIAVMGATALIGFRNTLETNANSSSPSTQSSLTQ